MGSHIFRIAKTEDREADEAEQEQDDAEAGALAECLGKLEAGIDKYDGEQDAQDGEQADAVFQRDLAHVIGAQDGDQAVPAGNAGLGKYLPHADDGHDEQRKHDDVYDRAVVGVSVAVVFLFYNLSSLLIGDLSLQRSMSFFCILLHTTGKNK